MRLVALGIAGLSGVSMALQGALNAVLGKKVGSFEAAFLVHLTGSIILAVILLTGMSQGQLKAASSAPWWSFLGGPLSVLIIWGVLSSIGKVGVGFATTAIVAAQITAALVLDMFGITGEKVPLDMWKGLGAVLFVLGAYLLLRRTG